MRKIKGDLVQGIPKGSLVLVRWRDANEDRCKIDEHESDPVVLCKDWGLYLWGSRGVFTVCCCWERMWWRL